MSRRALPIGLVALLALGVSAAYGARPGSGPWTGKVSHSTATVSFRVNAKRTRIVHLVARDFPVFCSSTDDTSFDAFVIPSVRVKHDGKFSRTYHPDKQSTLIVRGRFTSARKLTGHLEEQSAGGVCVGGLAWSAHRK